jgi:hypothetical protein
VTITTFTTATNGVYTLIETPAVGGGTVRHLIGKSNSPFVRISIDFDLMLFMRPPTIGESFRTEFLDKNTGNVVPFWTSPVTAIYTIAN